MKKTTTARGAPKTRVAAEKAWVQAWSALPQSQIQAWIERIPRHIQEIIRLKGGNEYPEGRKAFKRDQAGARRKGKLSKHTYLQAQAQGDYSLGGLAGSRKSGRILLAEGTFAPRLRKRVTFTLS
jgi:hypothetical protein